jgi:phosphoglycolate phosphatase-like HAD superfamily hydrolase
VPIETEVFNRDAIKAVLFDLDGTLINTDDQAVERLQRRLRAMGLRNPQRVARRIVMVAETPLNHVMTLFDMLGLDAPLAIFSRQICRWRGLSAAPDFTIIEGVPELLANLRERYRLGVVTTRPVCDAQAFLGQHQLSGLFEVVVTSETTWRLKPHPAPICYALQALNLRPENCVMVGDTRVDVRSARRAGAWAVGVLCGFGERAELERAGAHAILEHTAQLTSIL